MIGIRTGMRFVIALLAIVPAVLCQLEPENRPRPAIREYTTIAGVCDPSAGAIPGASFSGPQGTLKACAEACKQNPNCKGLNLVTDEARCQLFRQECDNAVPAPRTGPTQNFYLRGEIACSTSTVGNEFVVAFMANRVAQPVNMSLEIWLTQDKEVGGSTVKLITDPSQGLARDVPVPYKQAVSTLLPFTWKVTDVDAGVTIEKKAVYLQSDVDFVLYGVNKEFFTADAYLGIPVRALGTRYIANSFWPPFYNTEFAVTPSQDDTTINITLPRSGARNEGRWARAPTGVSRCALPFRGQTYTNGQSFSFKLQRFEVAQIQDPCDLTGAIIQSDKPIAFWSGNSRVNIGDSPSRDHQVEQLFSTDTWGTDCAAWPTPNRAEGLTDYWVITAAEDNTVIKVVSSEAGETSYTLNAAESVRFPARSVREWQRFSSTKKFQAVQYAHSAVDNSIPGDPSMTTCIPSDQFGFGYTFVTPTGVATTYTNFLTLITKKGGEGGFVLDGQPVRGVQWNDIPDSDLVGGFVRLDSSKQQFRIEHRVRGTTFEAYIFGSGDRESIAYPTGACIKALGECVPSTMFIADGKDNDCDGVIDEELFDGIDNDFDGKIDEDCYDRRVITVTDRCPDVKVAQGCYGQRVELNCDSDPFNKISIVSAHFGRLQRQGELSCGGENTLDSCSNTDADSASGCPFTDISSYVRGICEGQQSCSSAVNAFALDLSLKTNCPVCQLYAHIQYVCLNTKESNHAVLSGKGYKASSWLSAGATSGTCAADSKDSCPGCNSVVDSPADIHHPSTASLAVSARRGWRPATCDSNPWIGVDLGGHYAVGHYAIQGCRKTDHWITSFGISYSSDGKTWKEIRDASGAWKVYAGNSDANSAKVCTLYRDAITARWLRIHPLTSNGAPCAHFDFGRNATLQGCSQSGVANSNFAKGNSAAFGSEATVTCDNGWSTQNGDTSYTVSCSQDGQWGGNFRPCNRKQNCGDIPSPSGGYANAPNNHVGAVVQWACLGGRRLQGANSATCQANGRWSAETPSCEQL